MAFWPHNTYVIEGDPDIDTVHSFLRVDKAFRPETQIVHMPVTTLGVFHSFGQKHVPESIAKRTCREGTDGPGRILRM